MEIHKPHAAKTWKEFFIELGTVVIGGLNVTDNNDNSIQPKAPYP